MADGDTRVNALIGGIVTIMTGAFVPLAPALGGAVSGYLEGGSRDDGLRVGLYAGLVALVPVVFLFLFVSAVLGAMGFGFGVFGGGHRMFGLGAGLGAVFVLFGLVVAAAYVVGLSALGGWLGNYVRYDTDVDL